MKKQTLVVRLVAAIFCIMVIGQFSAQSQEAATFVRNQRGDQFFNKSNLTMEGSPYYPYQFCAANIKVANGNLYQKPKVRLGLIDNLVYYLADDTTELVVGMPVEKIEFTNCVEGIKIFSTTFQSGFPAVDKQTEATFYQVLDTGNAKLLKHLLVTYTDDKPYNSASITRVFKTTETLYANAGGKMVKLNKGKESVINALQDKKAQVEAFINSKGLKCKKEEDVLMVFNYYNSL